MSGAKANRVHEADEDGDGVRDGDEDEHGDEDENEGKDEGEPSVCEHSMSDEQCCDVANLFSNRIKQQRMLSRNPVWIAGWYSAIQ